MPVDAPQLHRLPVDQQLARRRYGNPAESERHADDLFRRANFQRIQLGILRVPQPNAGNGAFAVRQRKAAAVRRGHRHLYRALPLHVGIHLHAAVQAGMDKEIAHVILRAFQQIDIPEDAVITVRILILKVCAAGPGEDDGCQAVLSGAAKVRHVKFRLQVRALGKPRKDTVYIEHHAAGNTFKDDEGAQAVRSCRKAAPVYAHRVEGRDCRRIKGDRVIDIEILLLPPAVALPAGGHGDAVRELHRGHVLRKIQRAVQISEIPGAVQAPHAGIPLCVRRYIVGPRCQAACAFRIRVRYPLQMLHSFSSCAFSGFALYAHCIILRPGIQWEKP